jgi:hypothetical protein
MLNRSFKIVKLNNDWQYVSTEYWTSDRITNDIIVDKL